MKHALLLVYFALLAASPEGLAQSAPAPRIPDTSEPTEGLRTQNAMSQSDLKRLGEMVDQWNRVERKSGVSPREARKRVGQMLNVLGVHCDLMDAAYRGRGAGDAQPYLYEAACRDGMGYLLSLAGDSLTGTSCLTGEEGGLLAACALPANADRTAVAATVLRGKSVACGVRGLKWLGVDAQNRDHVEVACDGGAGYVVRAPRPGNAGELEVLECAAATEAGVHCKLTASATEADSAAADGRPTLAWFKEALSRNGVSCQVKRARIVGRESIKRRYVVEFECEDRPQGLVAFVPAAGDTVTRFESVDCAAAASRGIRCQFVAGTAAPPAK